MRSQVPSTRPQQNSQIMQELSFPMFKFSLPQCHNQVLIQLASRWQRSLKFFQEKTQILSLGVLTVGPKGSLILLQEVQSFTKGSPKRPSQRGVSMYRQYYWSDSSQSPISLAAVFYPNAILSSSSPNSHSVQSQILAPNSKKNKSIILGGRGDKRKHLNYTFLISEKRSSLQDTQHIFRQVYA